MSKFRHLRRIICTGVVSAAIGFGLGYAARAICNPERHDSESLLMELLPKSGPATQGGSDFPTDLEFVLTQWLVSGDRRAAAFAEAAVFLKDGECMRGAIEALVRSRSPLGRDVLHRSVKRVQDDADARDDSTAPTRMSALMRLAEILGEGVSYVRVCIAYMDSQNDSCRYGASHEIRELHRYLSAVKAKAPVPSVAGLWEDVREPAAMSRAKAEWIEWLASAEDEDIENAMSRFIEDLRARHKQAFDKASGWLESRQE